MRIPALLLLMLPLAPVVGQDLLSPEDQVKAAVQAAPEAQRDSATVLGFSPEGKVITLREGTNSMICLADDPARDGFSVACYQKDLEPFMRRGRELREEGMDFQEVFKEREKEAGDGKLSMPDHPAILHVLSGDSAYYDNSSGEVKNASLRWVVYIPYATAETTGLPTSPPVPGAPWIMFPGTHAAHIMITPPKN